MAAPALASPGHAGLAHIGALPVPEGTQWAGVGIGSAYSPYGGVAGAIVEGGGALGRRGALHGHLGVAGDFFGDQVVVLGTLSARHLLVDRPNLRFAITGQWLTYTYVPPFGGNGRLWENKLSPGIALDAGSRVVRFDLSLPIWGVISVNQFFGVARFPVPQAFTMGLTVRATDHHHFRFAAPDGISWHYRAKKGVYVDLGGVPFILGSIWFKVGSTF